MKVTALIAEDEPLLREELAEHLAALWPDLEVVGKAADGVTALRLMHEHVPDVLFLDIRMPGLTGIELARQAGGRSHVVFVTAFDQHAVDAFEQGAVDYVLKPVNAARLATTVARLKERVTQPPADLSGLIARLQRHAGEGKAYLRWVNASVGATIRLITIEEVCYFRADRKYTLVATPGADSLIRRTIRELQGELDPTMFWQVHRATLVNVHAIAGVTRDVRGYLQVRLKQRPELLPVSETYAHLFRQM